MTALSVQEVDGMTFAPFYNLEIYGRDQRTNVTAVETLTRNYD